MDKKKLILILSLPPVLSAVLLTARYAFGAGIPLLWALSPLWLCACAALLVFYAVWLVIAVERWRVSHGKKVCRNCLHCSIADLKPGRKLCLESMKEVSPTQKGCEKFTYAVRKAV